MPHENIPQKGEGKVFLKQLCICKWATFWKNAQKIKRKNENM